MWREDWSAAAQTVAALVHSGVSDIESYYAQRPDELRALRARVIIKDVNDRAVEEAGAAAKEDMLGSLDRLLPDTDQTFVQWLVTFARGDRYFRSEAHVTDPDGGIRETLFAASLPADIASFSDIIVMSVDITNFKRLQGQLLAAEADMARATRVTAIGALTASIAHEVNGPLAAIMANAEAAQRFMRGPDPQLQEVAEALTALVADAARATEVVKRTRAFITRAAPERAPTDVMECVRQAIELVERELRRLAATAHVDTVADLPLALADPIQLQQILVNLLMNAAQALVGADRPRDIRVDVRLRGESIIIEVIDDGPGIEPGLMNRIFDPFFTTREGGMGMGLAIARASAEAQAGQLIAVNRPEGGAIFRLFLPVAGR